MTADTEDKHVPQCTLTIKTVSFLTLDVQEFVAGRIYGSLGTTAAEVRWLSSPPPGPKLFSEHDNNRQRTERRDDYWWELLGPSPLSGLGFLAWASPGTIQSAPSLTTIILRSARPAQA